MFLRIFMYCIHIFIFSCMYKVQIFKFWYLFCNESNSFIYARKCYYVPTLSLKGFLNPLIISIDINIFLAFPKKKFHLM